MAEFPPVPLTLEGSAVLHQFFRFDWKAWRSCVDGERNKTVAEFTSALKKVEQGAGSGVQTGLFSQLGHKGDLILMHFRDSLEALNQVELDLAQTTFYDFLTPTHSYVSVVELDSMSRAARRMRRLRQRDLRHIRRSGMQRLQHRFNAAPTR